MYKLLISLFTIAALAQVSHASASTLNINATNIGACSGCSGYSVNYQLGPQTGYQAINTTTDPNLCNAFGSCVLEWVDTYGPGSIDVYYNGTLAYTGQLGSTSVDTWLTSGGGYQLDATFTLNGYSGSGIFSELESHTTFGEPIDDLEFQGTATPEPSSLLLLGTGLLGLGLFSRHRFQ